MATLLYQGHGSYRITSDDGIVIYVDPYAGEGYNKLADIVIVTHEHHDHNNVNLVHLKEGGILLRHEDLYRNGDYRIFDYKDIIIRGVPAQNKNHPREECVGFILDIDGLRIYGSGDTSYFEEMNDFKNLDYALLCSDGVYNMDMKEASRVADLLDVKHAIPVHMAPGKKFDEDKVKDFTTSKALILRPRNEITLK